MEPVVHPPRKIPETLRSKLKDELEKMEQSGVISKVNEPTPWVNSIVVNEKQSGKLRVCIDPRDLNKAVKREHYQLPTQDEITARLAGAKYFSHLDAKSGFWQIPLDTESSLLTTFNTPFGRFRFYVKPFSGLVCLPKSKTSYLSVQHVNDIEAQIRRSLYIHINYHSAPGNV